MSISQLLRPKSILALVLTFAIASVAYGFAAANTLTTLGAGDSGYTDVSGYTVENLTYVFDATDDTLIDKITFTLNPDELDGPEATNVLVWVNAEEDAIVATGSAGATWTVDMPALSTISAFDQMRVVAYSETTP